MLHGRDFHSKRGMIMVFTAGIVQKWSWADFTYSYCPLCCHMRVYAHCARTCPRMCPLRTIHTLGCEIRAQICAQNLPQDSYLELTPRIPIPSSKYRWNFYRERMTRKMLLMVRTGNNTILHFLTLFHTILFIVISARGG